MIEILSDYELELMREAGKLVAKILVKLGEEIKPGMSTQDLDDIAMNIIKEAGGKITTVDHKEITLDRPCSILATNGLADINWR